MSIQFDRFEIPSNETLENVKRRVAAWLASGTGEPYAMRVVSEQHVIFTKTKHNNMACAIPCIYFCLTPLFVLLGVLAGFGSYYVVLMFLIFYFVSAFACILGGIYCYCLQPNKAEYEFHFSEEQPIQVTVIATGSLVVGATDPEYVSLRQAVIGRESTEGANLT